MPSEDTNILEFNQHQKCNKAPFLPYADLECLVEKTDGWKNNPKNSSIIKVRDDNPSSFSMSAISSFKSIENKRDVYRGKGCMKKFCQSLGEHRMEMSSFKKKRMKSLRMQISVIFVKKNFKINMVKIKNIVKLETIVIMQVNIDVLHIVYVIQSLVYLKIFL